MAAGFLAELSSLAEIGYEEEESLLLVAVVREVWISWKMKMGWGSLYSLIPL